MEEQGSKRARAGLSQHLGRQGSERETRVNETSRKIFGDGASAIEDLVEPDLLRMRDALGEVGEDLAVVEVGNVDDVPLVAKVGGPRLTSGRQSLCVMKKQNFSHADPPP
jgi:hypothetical protein